MNIKNMIYNLQDFSGFYCKTILKFLAEEKIDWRFEKISKVIANLFAAPTVATINELKNQLAHCESVCYPFEEKIASLKEKRDAEDKVRDYDQKHNQWLKNTRIPELESMLEKPLKKIAELEAKLSKYTLKFAIESTEKEINKIKEEYGKYMTELEEAEQFRYDYFYIRRNHDEIIDELMNEINSTHHELESLTEYTERYKLQNKIKELEAERSKALEDANFFGTVEKSSIVFFCAGIWRDIKAFNQLNKIKADIEATVDEINSLIPKAERALFLESFAETDAEITEYCQLSDTIEKKYNELDTKVHDWYNFYRKITEPVC